MTTTNNNGTKLGNEINLAIANATLFSWSIYQFGDKVMGDTNEITTSANKKLMKVYKTLFSSRDEVTGSPIECKEWKAVKSAYNDIGTELRVRSTPLYTYSRNIKRMRRGIRIVNARQIPLLERIIEDKEKEAKAVLESFLKVYPVLIENAKLALAGQYSESDFPTPDVIRSRFGISWSYLPFGQPSNLPKEVLEREMQAEVEANKETARECRLALRQGLLSLVDHLTDVLTPDAKTGKRKKFYESNLEKIVEFQKLLEFTDLTNDDELRTIADKARLMVSDASPEDIKLGGKVTDKVMQGAKDIAESLRTMVGEVKGRKFDFSDDEG